MSRPNLSQRIPRQYDQQIFAQLMRDIEREFYRVSTLGGEVTWNPSSINNNASTTTTVDVPGVKVGAKQSVRVFPPYTLSGLTAGGYVSANDTVTIVLTNNTGSPVDLGSGTWGVVVESFLRA